MAEVVAGARSKADAHALGVLLLLVSNVFFALSGVFTKSVSADLWTILGWRGFVGGVLVALYVAFKQRRAGRSIDLRLDRWGWLIAFVSAGASVLFIGSFKLTSVASVVVIYATMPFMAAALALFAFGERLGARTLIAAGLSFVGVLISVRGSFGNGMLLGDLVAALMTFACAVYIVMIRAFQNTNSVWASGMAAFILVPVGLAFGDYGALSQHDALLMTLFGASFAAAVVLWTEGGRLIPSGEAGLLGTAELPMAIALAWLFIGEAPGLSSLFGGAVVLLAVSGHAWLDMRSRRRL